MHRALIGSAIVGLTSLSTTPAFARVIVDQLTITPNDSSNSSIGVVSLNTMSVSVRATPAEEVHAVEAEYAGETIVLTRSQVNGMHSGRFDLTQVPYGPHTLTITAYDRYGEASTLQRLVHRYANPTMSVISPQPYSPVTRDLRIVAECVVPPPLLVRQFQGVRAQPAPQQRAAERAALDGPRCDGVRAVAIVAPASAGRGAQVHAPVR